MKRIIIAVTGGIGSGKSTVLKILSQSDFSTVSCDDVYKKILNSRIYKKKIKEIFPDCVKGKWLLSVDKKSLSNKVFNDKKELEKLNAITHPLIMERALKQANRSKTTLSFVEVPLLFEGGFQDLFHHVIVVKRALSDRIESVKIRSSLSEKEILERMNNQIDYESFDFSDYTVIENNGTERELREKICVAIKKIKAENQIK